MNQTCKHFNTCGGCLWLDVPYEEQLKRKHEKIVSTLSDFDIGKINQIIPSEKIFFYRNKMEFACASPYLDKKAEGTAKYSDPKSVNLGLRERKKYYKVVNIEKCLLQSEKSNSIINIVRDWVTENELEPYNLHSHKGLIRYLIIREGKTTNQIMVNLIINTTKYQFEYGFKDIVNQLVTRLKTNIPELKCFIVGFYSQKGDAAKYDDTYTMLGDGIIEEKIGDLKYRISADTFFQTNPYTVTKMYSVIKEFLDSDVKDTGATCLDVCCGCGGISLFVSKLFEKVIGIEQNISAVNDAKINADINNITNCEFVSERAETFLKKLVLSKFHTKLSTVIVDPPRAGITKKALNAIIELDPNLIIYVSCNLQSMYNDLQRFIKFYKIDITQPVDMFPHTAHIETIAKLVHR